MEKTIFLCENSIDGIFTGVYDAWDSRLGHEQVELQVSDTGNYKLFADYRETAVSGEKSKKVARTLQSRLGEEAYTALCQAALSKEEDKADPIYRTIVAGLSMKNGSHIMEHLSHPSVFRVFELSRAVGHEAHRYLGFVRFKELFNGVLFSKISPDNHVLPLIGPHFADRLPDENWLLYDEKRCVFLVHEAGRCWVIVEGEELNPVTAARFSESEAEFELLWKGFCSSISVKERENKNLQRQNLPLKFRTHMGEFF